MGTGIGRMCERCGEQLNYDDGFKESLCNKCYCIVKYEKQTDRILGKQIVDDFMRDVDTLLVKLKTKEDEK